MKVYPFEIPKPISENLTVQEDKEFVFFDKLHQHKEIQISLIVEGTGETHYRRQYPCICQRRPYCCR